ncbi:MAG: YndJ family transporter [Saprospiraceae bacterium]|nr:YndJ family transporter [Saprospiraceae bacterium]
MSRRGLLWTSFGAAALWGALVWLLLLAWHRPELQHDLWARLALQLAVLVWLPLSLSMLPPIAPWLRWFAFPAALGVVVALQLPVGLPAVLWSLPWLLLCARVFVSGAEAVFLTGGHAGRRAVASGQVFLLIGGLALTADRLGLRPLGFDPAIILLTAVHFHYAGFIFPILLGWAAERWPSALFRYAAGLAVLAVPVTALGITYAQVYRSFGLEALAASLVALAGYLGAWGYVQVIWRERLPVTVRISWAILAICLLFSMTLGLGYALRPYWPLEGLTIPSMRALHGTANALGLAGGGLLGWYFLNRNDRQTNL